MDGRLDCQRAKNEPCSIEQKVSQKYFQSSFKSQRGIAQLIRRFRVVCSLECFLFGD